MLPLSETMARIAAAVLFASTAFAANPAIARSPPQSAPTEAASLAEASRANSVPATTTRLPLGILPAASNHLGRLELARRAPAPTLSLVAGYKYLGCYQDGSNLILSATSYHDTGLTPDVCRNLCVLAGFPVFGLESGTYCYCDKALAPHAVSTDEALCTSTCWGNPLVQCGGSRKANVYTATAPLSTAAGPVGE